MRQGDVTMNVRLVRQLMNERACGHCPGCLKEQAANRAPDRDHCEQGWTWSDLARQMGVSKSTVSRIARLNNLPGGKFIFALQRIFPEHRDQLFIPISEQAIAEAGERPPPADSVA